jgi:hypothetical protein
MWHVSTQENEAIEPPTADPVLECLEDLPDKLDAALTAGPPTADAVRIDRIALLEKLRAVTAALQAAESVRFAQAQVAEQLAAVVHPTSFVELEDTRKHAGRDLDPRAAEHSAEARGRFILDHDPASAGQFDGPQLTATNQLPRELSR